MTFFNQVLQTENHPYPPRTLRHSERQEHNIPVEPPVSQDVQEKPKGGIGSFYPPKSPAEGPPEGPLGEFSGIDMSCLEGLGDDFGVAEPIGAFPWAFTPFPSQLEYMNLDLEFADSLE